MVINLQNVEELIFFDKRVRKLLPELSNYFSQWELANYSPGLRTLGRRTLMEFLNALDDSHIQILSDYFKEPVTLMKLDHHIVQNDVYSIDDLEDGVNSIDIWVGNLAVYRDAEHCYISRWR